MAHCLKNAATEVVVPGGGEGRPSEDRHDLAVRENAVRSFDGAELDLHLAARAGVADGLIAHDLAQPLAHCPGASGFGGQSLHVTEDCARQFGLREQGAAGACDGGGPQVAHLGGPGDPGGKHRPEVPVPDVGAGDLCRELSGRMLRAHGCIDKVLCVRV